MDYEINDEEIEPLYVACESELYYKDESYNIIGAAMQVHTNLGLGFLEAVYQEALELEFIDRNIPYQREQKINIFYKDKKLEKHYRADFICYKDIIVELKAYDKILPIHCLQLYNYLKATKYKVGILICFGAKELLFKRIVN